MTDYCLCAPDKEAMHAAFAAVGIATEDGLRSHGRLPDGTSWAMLEYGPRWTGSEFESAYWVVLRWNGSAPTPPVPPTITIAWTSDTHPYEAYPQGLPRFA